MSLSSFPTPSSVLLYCPLPAKTEEATGMNLDEKRNLKSRLTQSSRSSQDCFKPGWRRGGTIRCSHPPKTPELQLCFLLHAPQWSPTTWSLRVSLGGHWKVAVKLWHSQPGGPWAAGCRLKEVMVPIKGFPASGFFHQSHSWSHPEPIHPMAVVTQAGSHHSKDPSPSCLCPWQYPICSAPSAWLPSLSF